MLTVYAFIQKRNSDLCAFADYWHTQQMEGRKTNEPYYPAELSEEDWEEQFCIFRDNNNG